MDGRIHTHLIRIIILFIIIIIIMLKGIGNLENEKNDNEPPPRRLRRSISMGDAVAQETSFISLADSLASMDCSMIMQDPPSLQEMSSTDSTVVSTSSMPQPQTPREPRPSSSKQQQQQQQQEQSRRCRRRKVLHQDDSRRLEPISEPPPQIVVLAVHKEEEKEEQEDDHNHDHHMGCSCTAKSHHRDGNNHQVDDESRHPQRSSATSVESISSSEATARISNSHRATQRRAGEIASAAAPQIRHGRIHLSHSYGPYVSHHTELDKHSPHWTGTQPPTASTAVAAKKSSSWMATFIVGSSKYHDDDDGVVVVVNMLDEDSDHNAVLPKTTSGTVKSDTAVVMTTLPVSSNVIVQSSKQETVPAKIKKRRCTTLLVTAPMLLLAVIALVTILVLHQASNGGSSSSNTSTTDGPTGAAASAPISRLDQLQTLLLNVSSATALSMESSPQHQALLWLANEDEANLTLATTPLDVIQERYVLALLFFATTTTRTNWTKSCNFLSKGTICTWNDQECGVFCDDNSTTAQKLNLSKAMKCASAVVRCYFF